MYEAEKEVMLPQLSTDIDKIIENTLRGSEKTVQEENLLPETKQRKPKRNVYTTRNTTRYQTKRSALNNFPDFWKPKLVTKDRSDFHKKKKYLDKDLCSTYTWYKTGRQQPNVSYL